MTPLPDEPLRDTCDDGSPCEAVCVMLCLESLAKCAIHEEPMVREAGGLAMPTVHGRIYCPPCQQELMDAPDRPAHSGD
jgi:hypothetical protein